MSAFSGPNVETTGLISMLSNKNPKVTLGSNVIKDIVNNSATTTSGLSYEGDNKTYYFNGSSSITLPYVSSMNFNNSQTIMMWIKPTDTTDARRNPYNQAYGGAGTITFEPSRQFNYFWGTTGTDGITYTSITSSFTVARNETAHIAITRNSTTTSWYKNGVLTNSVANPYATTTLTGTSPIIIGSGYAGGYIGYIYSFKVYNSALSATKIKQNFNALRGRFGI
jgi:hypothetical protein